MFVILFVNTDNLAHKRKELSCYFQRPEASFVHCINNVNGILK